MQIPPPSYLEGTVSPLSYKISQHPLHIVLVMEKQKKDFSGGGAHYHQKQLSHRLKYKKKRISIFKQWFSLLQLILL